MSDYYDILGISKSANDDEIKNAYRKLAKTHHPDKGGDKSKFQEIQTAYETLSDINKRNNYNNSSSQNQNTFQFPFQFDHVHRTSPKRPSAVYQARRRTVPLPCDKWPRQT